MVLRDRIGAVAAELRGVVLGVGDEGVAMRGRGEQPDSAVPVMGIRRKAGLRPDAVVIVTTIRAAKMHGGVKKDNLGADDPYRVDSRTIELEPEEGREYKYYLREGSTMLYSWVASGPVRVEMHSEEDGTPDGTAEFFDVVPAQSAGQGTFLAPFPGIHGWYWENQTDEAVTVTIRSSGFYTYGVEFPAGRTDQLPDVVEAAAAE